MIDLIEFQNVCTTFCEDHPCYILFRFSHDNYSIIFIMRRTDYKGKFYEIKHEIDIDMLYHTRFPLHSIQIVLNDMYQKLKEKTS